MAQATFAAGCFWGVEVAFRRLNGVTATAVGYTGGGFEDPSYEDVCTGGTGHAEAVRVEFDPARISYQDLLELFWQVHDPTQLNRQGADVGTQYRSARFFHDPEQDAAARASKAALDSAARPSAAIVTEITPATRFWIAEDYHQRYLEKRGATRRRWF